jgi:plasmid stabilization system protein ParE
MSGYAFHPEARNDLDEVREFIASDSTEAADRVVVQILETVRKLIAFPHQGHRRTDLTSRQLRFARVYDSLIAYAPDEDPLWVVAIIHGNRSPRVMAAILRGREQ